MGRLSIQSIVIWRVARPTTPRLQEKYTYKLYGQVVRITFNYHECVILHPGLAAILFAIRRLPAINAICVLDNI